MSRFEDVHGFNLVSVAKAFCVLLGTVMLVSCSDSEQESLDREVVFRPPYARCSEREGFAEYIYGVAQRMRGHWQLPEGSDRSAMEVRIVFALDENANLRRLEISEDTPRELRLSATKAMETAAPFLPFPEGLECISELDPLAISVQP